MKSDIQIAREAQLKPISEIAKVLNISEDNLYVYGNNKAKIEPITTKGNAKVVIVSAISPTPAGEGKSTITIGLGDALNKLGKKAIVCLREPSMGPVFGLKGGACGGGYHQVVPMEDINLHFTGDMHAITSANNLICAVMDNSIYQGNDLNIDPDTITLKRVIDMNDRELRDITIGQGSKYNGVERQDHFEITVACEIMAILCLSSDEKDFENRISNMVIAKTFDGKLVRVKDLGIVGSIMALMKDALKPNLVQTLENNPVLVHGGPFANIAHGCNSIIATNTARNLGEIVVTEAGFGSDLGFEKFMDIKSRVGDFNVDCGVLVATIRALKMHGGVDLDHLNEENLEALEVGFANLLQHATNMQNTGIDIVVCLNQFASDTANEIELFKQLCAKHNLRVSVSNGFSEGSDGVIDLANNVLDVLANDKISGYNYELSDSLDTKLNKVITNCYGGSGYILTDEAKVKFDEISNSDVKDYPICIAKTPKSFSDDEHLINAPHGFTITFTDFKVNYGAGFIVCYANKIMTLPGLNKEPNAMKITYDNGAIDHLS